MQKNERLAQPLLKSQSSLSAPRSTQVNTMVMNVRSSDPLAGPSGGNHYPIPSTYEHRIKAKDHDPL